MDKRCYVCKVKSHNGNIYNEKADTLALAGSRKIVPASEIKRRKTATSASEAQRVSSETVQTMNRPRKHCGQIPKPLGKRRDYFKIAEGGPLSKKGTSPPVETGVDSPEKKECLPEEYKQNK